jgi:putative sugar O-methyltransferase
LQNCALLADFAKNVSLNKIDTILELGAGLGRNIEVLAHLLPNATLFVVDIPPQLYVTNQYLSKVFGDRVIPYRKAIALKPKTGQGLPVEVKGKIVILPSWQMPAWSDIKINLFWNSASFQEMEPDVVTNYLGLVKKMSPEWIYINALPGGNYRGTWSPGKGGTKLPVTDDIYRSALQPEYGLDSQYNTDYFLRINDYQSYIYKR